MVRRPRSRSSAGTNASMGSMPTACAAAIPKSCSARVLHCSISPSGPIEKEATLM